jgi:hypothetical protein
MFLYVGEYKSVEGAKADLKELKEPTTSTS